MIDRPVWTGRILSAWRKAPIVWLAAPRRTGKTVLARSLPKVEYFNGDLPSVQRALEEPESFFRGIERGTVVLDEVHQLSDPSRLLKIGADAFPRIRILATGSSTLAATSKFRDTLTGRKRVVSLTPVLHEELGAFGITDLRRRLLRGGLPPSLLAEDPDPEFFSEWRDSYFARDVQELFRVEKRAGFLRVFELLLRQSGGLLDVTRLSKESQISRPTVVNWLEVYQATQVAHLVRPFSGGGQREIVAQPKVYGFDTGLVCHARGWDTLRSEDCGGLWEHLVLDALIATGVDRLLFWRDKQGREIDFVVPRGRDAVDAIECKWNPEAADARGFTAFRDLYPRGRNFLVAPTVTRPYDASLGKLKVRCVSPHALRTHYSGART